MANFQKIMGQIGNKCQSGLNGLCKSYAGDNGKMLLHMGALGWILSSVSHTFMVAKSKNIDKEKKKFLLWQEGLDGAVNVGFYYTLTDFAKRYSDWVCENRRMPESTIKAAKDVAGETPLVDFFKSNAQEFAKGGKKKIFKKLGEQGASGFYKKTIDALAKDNGLTKNEIFNIIDQAQSKCGGDFKQAIASLKGKGQISDQLLDVIQSQREFRTFKNGVGTAVSILASIVAINIVTPIVRNKLTGRIVKDKQEAPEDRKVFYNTARPMPVVFKNVGGNLKI